MILQIVACDWTGCVASVTCSRSDRTAADARARTRGLGWSNTGRGRDYCPQHRALLAIAPPRKRRSVSAAQR